MKPKFFSALLAIGFASSLLASGATLTWNGAGSGPWDTTTTNWLNGATPTAWNNATPDNAVFSTPGTVTVTLGTAITTNNIAFTTTGYTIAGASAITLTGTTPTISVNTGTSSDVATISAPVTTTLGYTKTGTGVLTWSGTKSFTGPVIVSAGTVNLSTGAAGSSLTVAAGATATTTTGNAAGYGTSCRTWNINGTFNISSGDSAWTDAVVLNNASMNGVSGSNWSMGGGSSITNTGTSTFGALGSFWLREGNPATIGGVSTLPITNNGTLIINCPVTSSNNVLFSGSGTTTLNGANTATGQAQVNSGTLAFGASSGSSPFSTITMASGAVFDVSALASGYTVASGKTLLAGRTGTAATDINGSLTVAGTLRAASFPAASSLTLNGNLTLNGGTVFVDRTGTTIHPINLTGTPPVLTLTGTSTFSAGASSGYFPDGTYTLISGIGTSAGTGTLAWGSAARGQTASFSVSGSTAQMTLSGSTPLALTWSGATSSVWDVNTTANFTNAGAQNFLQGDAVTFADSPTSATVTITGSVAPSSIAFTNASTAYLVSGGTGNIVGSTTVTKTGGGSVSLWNASNTFSGGTTISGGVLALNFGAAVTGGTYTPLGTGPVTVNSGGTFRVDPGNFTGGTYTFPNAITLNGGLLHEEDGVNHFTGVTTVSAASTITTQYGNKDIYLDGGLAGSGNLVVSNYNQPYGSGAVEVTADGTYSGTITLNASAAINGLLIARSNGALANASVVVNDTSGVDTYDGTRPVGFVIGSPATNVTVASLGGTTTAGTVTTWPADGAVMRTLTVNNSTNSTFAGRIGGDLTNTKNLNLVKSGTGTLTLNGANTYTGTTTVTGGKLSILSSQTGTGAITVNDGTTLDVSIVSGVTLSPSSLTLGSSTGATLSLRSFASGATAPVTTSTLTTNGTVTVNIAGTFSSGTFPLLKYTPGGSIGGSGFAALTLGTLPRGVTASLVNDSTNGVVNLVIGATASLTWTGSAGTAWDLNTTVNWTLNSVASTFQNGDVVLFDNTAGANTSAVLSAAVSPASVTVNSTNNYSITGSGSIGGTGTLTNSGTGTLTLATANTYTGSTVISAGTVKLGSATALGGVGTGTSVNGDASAGTSISGTGVLDLNGTTVGAEGLVLGASGVEIINSSGTAGAISGAITLTAATSVGGTGNFTLGGAISGSSTFTKVGTGTVTLSGTAGIYPFTGNVVLSGGNTIFTRSGGYGRLFNTPINVQTGATLTVSNENALQNYTSTLTIESGGTLTTASGVTSNIGGAPNGTFNMQGGSTLAGDGNNTYGSWTINTTGYAINVVPGASATPAVISAQKISSAGSTINLAVADVTGDANPDLILSGSIGGAGGLSTATAVSITGAGTVSLSGTNTCTGNTTVAGGAGFILGSTGQMKFKIGANGVNTTVTGGGTAVFNGTFNLDTSGATLASGNSWTLVNGALAASYGGTFTIPGYTKSGTVWTQTNGSSIFSFDQATGVLTYTVNPYLAWVGGFGLTGSNALPTADPDHDGIPNLIEFVLGGNPATGMDAALLPTVDFFTGTIGTSDTDVDYFRFTFRRSQASASLNPGAFYNTDLGTWVEAATAPGVQIVELSNYYDDGSDKVMVFLPKTLAGAGGRMFVRLQVTAP